MATPLILWDFRPSLLVLSEHNGSDAIGLWACFLFCATEFCTWVCVSASDIIECQNSLMNCLIVCLPVDFRPLSWSEFLWCPFKRHCTSFEVRCFNFEARLFILWAQFEICYTPKINQQYHLWKHLSAFWHVKVVWQFVVKALNSFIILIAFGIALLLDNLSSYQFDRH